MSLGLLTSSLRVLKTLKSSTTEQSDKILQVVTNQLVADDNGDFSHIYQRKTRMQMVLLSCAVCGIEFCYAAETAFVSPTLLKIGVHVLYMTLIWCLSPILGFFLVPVLGSLSDRCNWRLGRRRPFILILSAGIVFGLIFVPNGELIGAALGDDYSDTPQMLALNATSSISSSVAYANASNNSTFFDSTEEPYIYSRKPHPWSILFTVLGTVMLDFSCDACQSPCRAYLLDVSVAEDHQTGLATFTVMAGLGGSLGYVMGGINWENTSFGESLGGHVKVVFTLVLIIYIVCLMLTITSVKEVPLDKLGVCTQQEKKSKDGEKYRKFHGNEEDETKRVMDSSQDPYYYGTNYNDQSLSEMMEPSGYSYNPNNPFSKGQYNDNSNTISQQNQPYQEINGTVTKGPPPPRPQPPKLAQIKKAPTITISPSPPCNQNSMSEDRNLAPDAAMSLPSEVSLKTYLMSIIRMPKSLVVLCITNLWCWMSLVCYSLYFTDFVGQAVYDGDPSTHPLSASHKRYEEGVRMGSFAMSLYSLSCSCYSLVIEYLVAKLGAKPVYIGSQLVYTVGAAMMAVTKHRITVVLLSPCAGVMYATLFTMPYLLVAHYHANNTFSTEEEEDNAQNPSRCKEQTEKQIRGLGTDIALVSSMVFVAQFILSACMGSIVHAMGSTVAVPMCAAVLSFLGAITATQVVYMGL